MSGQNFFAATFSDITDRKEFQAHLDKLAFYDSLTQLPNRQLLKQFLSNSLFRSDPQKNKLAVLFLDLDKFKDVNDRFGHDEGDLVLKESTQRITARIRESDMASRIGGDEFVVVLSRFKQREDVFKVAENLLESLAQPIKTVNGTHRLSVSIGVAFYPEHGNAPEDLLRRADTAMYQAKRSGRNGFSVFDLGQEDSIHESNRVLGIVWEAMEKPKQHIQMHYQPIFALDNPGTPAEYEALIRIVDSQQKMVFPDEFITRAEESGLMPKLGLIIFEQICQDILAIMLDSSTRIAVNLSVLQFSNELLVDELEVIAKRYKLSLSRFNFEVTETATMENLDWVVSALEKFRRKGCKVFLDDFGTGFASLSVLKNLPVDVVKIDRGFVQDLETSEQSTQLVLAMIGMAKALNLEIITEGVETQAQYDWLAAQDVDYLQGYLLGKPKPLSGESGAN